MIGMLEVLVKIQSASFPRYLLDIALASSTNQGQDVLKQSDWVAATHSTLSRALDWYLHTKSLKIDHGGKHHQGCEKIHDVWKVLAIKGFLQSSLLVWPCEQEVEERDDSAFELRATACIDGRRGESLPYNGFADIRGDKQRNTARFS